MGCLEKRRLKGEWMRKSALTVLGLFVSAITVLFFQNCSQGSSSTPAASTSATSVATTNATGGYSNAQVMTMDKMQVSFTHAANSGIIPAGALGVSFGLTSYTSLTVYHSNSHIYVCGSLTSSDLTNIQSIQSQLSFCASSSPSYNYPSVLYDNSAGIFLDGSQTIMPCSTTVGASLESWKSNFVSNFESYYSTGGCVQYQ
jgi:hypothetical protein